MHQCRLTATFKQEPLLTFVLVHTHKVFYARGLELFSEAYANLDAIDTSNPILPPVLEKARAASGPKKPKPPRPTKPAEGATQAAAAAAGPSSGGKSHLNQGNI